MKDTDQIAAEATTGFLGYPRDDVYTNRRHTWDALYESIKAAIEEATDAEKQRNFDAEKELRDKARARIAELESRAAHASEPELASWGGFPPPNKPAQAIATEQEKP